MQILVLAKRQYTGKDLIDDRYGRLFELPERLQRRGHDVRGITLSYRARPEASYVSPEGVRWQSLNALPVGLVRYDVYTQGILGNWRPDVIWASSDALHAILGRRLAARFRVPYVVDLYDNYESFALTRFPGLWRGLREACRDAAGVTVVTRALQTMVAQDYVPHGPVTVVGNGVDPGVFHPRDLSASRRRLGLPEQGQIIGTAGSITKHRGIDDLFRAFMQLAAGDPRLWLAVAGPGDGTAERYSHERVINLGRVAQQVVADLLCALDVAIVCNRDSAFGRYCYPMKLEEAIACDTPVVAAGVGDVPARLAFDDDSLYVPGDAHDLASKLAKRLATPQRASLVPATWSDLVPKLEHALEHAVAGR